MEDSELFLWENDQQKLFMQVIDQDIENGKCFRARQLLSSFACSQPCYDQFEWFHTRYAQVCNQLNEPTQALIHLDALKEKLDRNAWWLAERGYSLELLGQYELAEIHFEEALHLYFTTFSFVHYMRIFARHHDWQKIILKYYEWIYFAGDQQQEVIAYFVQFLIENFRYEDALNILLKVYETYQQKTSSFIMALILEVYYKLNEDLVGLSFGKDMALWQNEQQACYYYAMMLKRSGKYAKALIFVKRCLKQWEKEEEFLGLYFELLMIHQKYRQVIKVYASLNLSQYTLSHQQKWHQYVLLAKNIG